VKEYFTQFGYVMDVYMPKAKDNKAVSLMVMWVRLSD
jgi:hypothetical protein